ncbi:T9SS type A sorting domain-containing protein [bacterium]|nr:T9SS type A sorting domain-containing protein [bacterium]
MKKALTLITYLLLIYSSECVAQNWSPLRIDKISNYKAQNASLISNCIWIMDTIVDNDTMFVLNKIAKKSVSDPNKLIRNQQQFFQNEIIKKENGEYIFSGNNTYVLKTHSSLDETWLFDTLNNLTAKTVETSTGNIFGVMDSVKIFQLLNDEVPTNWEIKLSKNYGILKFPNFDSTGHYNLCGFQNDTMGEQIVGYWDIVDYAVNDVYEFHGRDANGSNGYIENFIKKYTITSKELLEDSIKYTIQGMYYVSGYSIFEPWDPYSYSYTIDQTIWGVYNPDNYTEKLPNELITLPETYYYNDLSIDEHVYTNITLDTNINGFRRKTIGGSNNLYYLMDYDSDTLYKITNDGIIPGYNGTTVIQYSEFLGNNYTKRLFFEGSWHRTLVGYIFNGDTTGYITPDSILVGINSHELPHGSLKTLIKPNPFTTSTAIEYELKQPSLVQFSIFNQLGKLIYQYSEKQQPGIQKLQWNAKDQPEGLYFYQLQTQDQTTKGKLVKVR